MCLWFSHWTRRDFWKQNCSENQKCSPDNPSNQSAITSRSIFQSSPDVGTCSVGGRSCSRRAKATWALSAHTVTSGWRMWTYQVLETFVTPQLRRCFRVCGTNTDRKSLYHDPSGCLRCRRPYPASRWGRAQRTNDRDGQHLRLPFHQEHSRAPRCLQPTVKECPKRLAPSSAGQIRLLASTYPWSLPFLNRSRNGYMGRRPFCLGWERLLRYSK